MPDPVPVQDALWSRLDDARYLPGDASRGPWDPKALHGGPTAALLAGALERHDADPDAHTAVCRVTLELLRPVPFAPLTLSTRTLRAGRKVQLVEATLTGADGRDVARAVGLRLRRQEVALPPEATDEAPPSGPAGASPLEDNVAWPAYHVRGVEMLFSTGGWRTPGPATVWVRLRMPVVAGREPSALERAAAAADFGNGVSWVLSYRRYRYINPDLTLFLDRPPEGEWVCLDAVTHVGPHGAGLAESRLYDRSGRIGRAVQTLLVEARDTPLP